MARWRPFDRMAWCLGVSAMGFVGVFALFVGGLLIQQPIRGPGHSSRGKVRFDLARLEQALESYSRANGGRFPGSLLPLVAPDANGRTFFDGTRIPKDPWGNEYMYDAPEPGRPVPRVYTYGKDGLAGGEGDDADVDNFSVRSDR